MLQFSPPAGTWQDDSLAEFFSLAPVFSAYRYLARGQPGGVFLTCFIFLRLQEHGKMTAWRSFSHLPQFSPPTGIWQDDSLAKLFSLAPVFSAYRYMARGQPGGAFLTCPSFLRLQVSGKRLASRGLGVGILSPLSFRRHTPIQEAWLPWSLASEFPCKPADRARQVLSCTWQVRPKGSQLFSSCH